jgi:glycosyltransferase involved in cell wall biosynthesis
MAYGLAVVTTNWRMIPELLPPDYPGIVPPQSPSHISQALTRAATLPGESLREHFLNHYTTEQFIRSFREALLALEKPEDRTNAVRTGV